MRATSAIGLLLASVVGALAADVPAGGAPTEPRSYSVTRERIGMVDGDSLTIDGREWRLMGFDTPETEQAGAAFAFAPGMGRPARGTITFGTILRPAR